METLKLFWFFLWRMTLWGLLLGAAALTIFAIIETVRMLFEGVYYGEFYTVGMVVVGGILGTVVGVLLGMLCGMVLFVLTRAFYWSRPAGHSKYRKTAGRVCVLTSILVLMADWINRILLDFDHSVNPFYFLPWRILNGGYDIGGTLSFSPTSAYTLTFTVIIPTLLLALVMWWAGRRVAGQWYRRVSCSPSDE